MTVQEAAAALKEAGVQCRIMHEVEGPLICIYADPWQGEPIPGFPDIKAYHRGGVIWPLDADGKPSWPTPVKWGLESPLYTPGPGPTILFDSLEAAVQGAIEWAAAQTTTETESKK